MGERIFIPDKELDSNSNNVKVSNNMLSYKGDQYKIVEGASNGVYAIKINS